MNKANILKYCSLIGKAVGLIASLNAIPFIPAPVGMVIFGAASILKDVVNRVGDLADDGVENKSFKVE